MWGFVVLAVAYLGDYANEPHIDPPVKSIPAVNPQDPDDVVDEEPAADAEEYLSAFYTLAALALGRDAHGVVA